MFLTPIFNHLNSSIKNICYQIREEEFMQDCKLWSWQARKKIPPAADKTSNRGDHPGSIWKALAKPDIEKQGSNRQYTPNQTPIRNTFQPGNPFGIIDGGLLQFFR